MKTKILSAVLATAICSGAVGTAEGAAQHVEVRQRIVSFEDLDLNRGADVATLYRRIGIAARDVCREAGVLAILRTASARRCASDAIARGVADVRSAALSRYHAARCSSACEARNEFAFVRDERTEAETGAVERR